MDPLRNPFAPGAGAPPPELAGREEIIASATVALARVRLGRPEKSQMLLGLRGVGKTVLLNRISEMAEDFYVAFLRAVTGSPQRQDGVTVVGVADSRERALAEAPGHRADVILVNLTIRQDSAALRPLINCEADYPIRESLP